MLQFPELRPNFDSMPAPRQGEDIGELIGVFGAVDGKRSKIAYLREALNIYGWITEVHGAHRQIVHAPEFVDVGRVILLQDPAQRSVEAEDQRVHCRWAEGVHLVDHRIVSGLVDVVAGAGDLRGYFRERFEQVGGSIAVPQGELVGVRKAVVGACVGLRLAVGPHRLAKVVTRVPAEVRQGKQSQHFSGQRIDTAHWNPVAWKWLPGEGIHNRSAGARKIAATFG